MSKSRSHFVATFRERAGILGEPTLLLGEPGVASSTVGSSIAGLLVQITAQQKGVS